MIHKIRQKVMKNRIYLFYYQFATSILRTYNIMIEFYEYQDYMKLRDLDNYPTINKTSALT